MYPRTQYVMTEEDFQKLLDACKPTPVMFLFGGTLMGSSPQENANLAWEELGSRMGFDANTVQPVDGQSARYFTAVPNESEVARAERVQREEMESKRANIIRLEQEVEAAKQRLAEALK